MPRTRRLETYPNAQFWALARATLDAPRAEPVTVPCTKTQAASLRGEWYAWRRAVEASPEQAAAYGIDAEALRGVALQITEAGLRALHASEVGSARLIEAALGPVAAAAPQPSAADRAREALERLRSLGIDVAGGPT